VNENIRQYFDVVEVRLIESQAVASYQIISRDVSFADGKMRIKSILSNDDTFEFFIYMTESNQQVVLEKYSFHWQDKAGCLLIRMDNAPHYPELTNAPHHIHKGKEVVEALLEPPELLAFLDEIEKTLL
jgi:hypothetical protein